MNEEQSERQHRAESLRLTQLALGLDLHGFEMVDVAHWVHTGRKLPDEPETGSPDAARWRPGDDQ